MTYHHLATDAGAPSDFEIRMAAAVAREAVLYCIQRGRTREDAIDMLGGIAADQPIFGNGWYQCEAARMIREGVERRFRPVTQDVLDALYALDRARVR